MRFLRSAESIKHVVEAYIDLASAYAQRGSPVDAKYYLHQAESTAKSVRSPAMQARAATRFAVLESRLKQLEKAQAKIDEATTGLENVRRFPWNNEASAQLTSAAWRTRCVRSGDGKRSGLGPAGIGGSSCRNPARGEQRNTRP